MGVDLVAPWILPLVWHFLAKGSLSSGRNHSGTTNACICSGSAGAGPSGARCLDEHGTRPEGFNPEDGDKGTELDLDDEPRVLLEFLNARRRRIVKSLFGRCLGFLVA